MPKAGDLDWSELYATGKNLQPEHPLSRPLKKGQTGEEHVNSIGKDIVKDILDGFKENGIRQPTDEELFGKLVKSEEEIKQIKRAGDLKWNNTLKAYDNWQPSKLVKSHNHDPESWGTGKPILSDEEREELKKANKSEVRDIIGR